MAMQYPYRTCVNWAKKRDGIEERRMYLKSEGRRRASQADYKCNTTRIWHGVEGAKL